MKKSGLKKSTLVLALLALCGMLVGGLFASGDDKPKTEAVAEQSIDYKKQWKKKSVKDPAFSIYFPGKAQSKDKEIPIPGSSDDQSLTITKHVYTKEGVELSVSHTQLPEQWLKYGASLVLKGALKLMAKHADDADIAGKTSNTFKGFPSLDYSHIAGSTQTSGTLVLCGDQMYAIEVKNNKDSHDIIHSYLESFLASFEPKSA